MLIPAESHVFIHDRATVQRIRGVEKKRERERERNVPTFLSLPTNFIKWQPRAGFSNYQTMLARKIQRKFCDPLDRSFFMYCMHLWYFWTDESSWSHIFGACLVPFFFFFSTVSDRLTNIRINVQRRCSLSELVRQPIAHCICYFKY